jgi:hypothetical protein
MMGISQINNSYLGNVIKGSLKGVGARLEGGKCKELEVSFFVLVL